MQRAAILILVAFLLTFVRFGVRVVSSAALDSGGKNDLGDLDTGGIDLDGKKLERKSFEISPGDETAMGHIADVIEALETLGVLSVQKENCYTLIDVIRTTSERDSDNGSRKVSVAINLHELDQRQRLHSPIRTPDVTSSPTTTSDHVTSGATMTSREDVASGRVKECILRSPGVRRGHPSEGGVVWGGAGDSTLTAEGVRGQTEGTEDQDRETEEEEERRNGTSGSSSNSSGVTRTKTEEEDGPRLSYTQVMVISTCSSVIGVFFIVAVIIRVKNYIKRVREEQAAARRPSFRSTSVSLRSNSQQNNSNPTKDGRLEAALNKDRDSVAMVMNCKDDLDEDGDITPKLTSQENRPLLIVTAASAPSSPCPQRARCDYQYSNGDDDETMTADETNSHSFRSKSAINNQYQQVSTAQTPPANRHQRANRSYNNRNYTRVGCSSQQVPGSLQEEEDDSGADSESEQLGHDNMAMKVLSTAEVGDPRQHGPDILDGDDDRGERLLSFGNMVNTESDQLEGSGVDDSPEHRMVEWDVYDSFSQESFQKQNFDLDYYPAETIQQSSGVLSSIPEGADMDGVGFTQSDSSISSNNPSYRYGNQVEYTGVQQYPNVEYVPEAHYDSGSTGSNVTIIHVPQEIPHPPRYMSQESTDSNIVIRQVSDDSLLYNESPPLRKRFTHLQSSSLEEDEKQDFWLEEEADDDDTSPNDVRDRFSFPNERFSFREDRLPNIREGERLDHHGAERLRGHQNYSPRMSSQGGTKTATLTRQKQSIRDDIGPEAGDNSDTDLEAMSVHPRGPHKQLNGEVVSRSSDSDTSETVSANLLPPQQQSQTRHRKKRHRRHRHNEGWSILQDPEFEGMEPTYV